MRLILLGPPGAGRAPRRRGSRPSYGIPQLSTGEMLREAVAKGTDVGKQAKAIMERGELVSDDIIIGIVAERIAQPDGATASSSTASRAPSPQAEALDRMLAERGLKLDGVVEIAVDDAALIDRIGGRFSCAKCGTGYHDRFKPPRGRRVRRLRQHRFVRRKDDNAETVRTRLDAYHAQTAPLLPYYRARGLLRTVDGMAADREGRGERSRSGPQRTAALGLTASVSSP